MSIASWARFEQRMTHDDHEMQNLMGAFEAPYESWWPWVAFLGAFLAPYEPWGPLLVINTASWVPFHHLTSHEGHELLWISPHKYLQRIWWTLSCHDIRLRPNTATEGPLIKPSPSCPAKPPATPEYCVAASSESFYVGMKMDFFNWYNIFLCTL